MENEPVAVSGAEGAVGAAAGEAHSCLWTGSGEVRCWGCDDLGQLGDGLSVLPDLCSCPSGSAACGLGAGAALSIAAVDAVDSGRTHGCASLADGSASCWGDNARGQVGDGSTTRAYAPVAVAGLTGVTSVSAGDEFSCAVASGEILCWGRNDRGQLGDGTTADHGEPELIEGI
jgi:alpha-tubulin suppressor-like RCC1 family protein